MVSNINKDIPYYMDERILSNHIIEYQLKIYDHLLKILNEFFKKDEILDLRKGILTNR
jgi:hypothetical protein